MDEAVASTIRLGGVSGLVSALAIIPAYAGGAPDRIWPSLHLLFGLMFLGVLVAMLRATVGLGAAAYVALGGGLVCFGLGVVGWAAEAEPLPLTLSNWLHTYSQLGAALLIFATSLVVWRTGVLPKWAAAGVALGLLPLLHSWLPLPAALSSLIWLGLIGLLMAIIPPVVRVQPTEAGSSHRPP